MRHNPTSNAGKNPIDRSDLWANGGFDFLLEKNYGDRYHKWVEKTKAKAIRSVKPLSSKYPNERK